MIYNIYDTNNKFKKMNEDIILNQAINFIENNVVRNVELQRKVLSVVDTISDKATSLSGYFNTTNNDFKFKFKSQNSLEDRCEIYKSIMRKNPTKIPIVVEFAEEPLMKPVKLLLDFDENVIRLIGLIRKSNRIPYNKSMFIITDTNQSLISSQSIGELYKDYLYQKEGCMTEKGDKIMYLQVFYENTFG